MRRTRYVSMTEDFSVRPNKPLTPEERKARDAQRRADAEQAMREHDAAQKKFYANKERLRAARLAREQTGEPKGEGKSAAGSR
ncbi:MAG TPA: hypothetical protein VFB20_10165 [Burkholderiales bacterium]|nr:hypothetical protein [Burkholderiales bacterium]